MQARFATTLFASTALVALALAATTASAQTDVLTVEGRGVGEACSGQTIHVSGASGGVWKTVDTGRGAAASAAPSGVTTAPAEARFDAYVAIDGVDGESSDDPHRDPPAEAPNCPTAESGRPAAGANVQNPQDPQAMIGLLVPAVQKVRSAASRAGNPQMDGVVLLNQEEEQATGTGTLTLTNGGQAVVPEPPVCGSCSPDVPVRPQPQAQQQQAEEQRERPRRNFSISIGGVTFGTGGVSVAAGDVDGDGRAAPSSSRTPSTRPARADDAGNGSSRRR